jgi:F-type H+-transporting ATPase subunit alpha
MAAFAQFASDLDAATQRLLNRGARLTELLKQDQYKPMSVAMQVCVVFAGVHGYLDRIAVGDVTRFERGLVGELEANGGEVLSAIQGSGEIGEATEAKLRTLLDSYAQAFA